MNIKSIRTVRVETHQCYCCRGNMSRHISAALIVDLQEEEEANINHIIHSLERLCSLFINVISEASLWHNPGRVVGCVY